MGHRGKVRSLAFGPGGAEGIWGRVVTGTDSLDCQAKAKVRDLPDARSPSAWRPVPGPLTRVWVVLQGHHVLRPLPEPFQEGDH